MAAATARADSCSDSGSRDDVGNCSDSGSRGHARDCGRAGSCGDSGSRDDVGSRGHAADSRADAGRAVEAAMLTRC